MYASYPAAPPPEAQPASGRSVAALVLGLLGFFTCQLLSPFAWWLGWAELRDIRLGLIPATGRDYATIGMVLGIIGSVLLALVLVVIVVSIVAILAAAGVAAVSST